MRIGEPRPDRPKHDPQPEPRSPDFALFDTNAWLGSFPFRSISHTRPEDLIERLDRYGIAGAAVSLIESVYHRNVQPANERLFDLVQPHEDRLYPLPVINPTYPKWEQDLKQCQDRFEAKGVRLCPQYHNYQIDGDLGRVVIQAATDLNLPIFIPHRIEDVRERHWIDPGPVLDLGRVANTIGLCPESTVVVQNARGIARSPLWQNRDIRDANWFVDLSLAEIHYGLHWDIRNLRDLADLIEEGGAGHLIFGTHQPISYAVPALVKLTLLPVDSETLEDIRHRTAERILRMTTSIPA